MKYFFHEWLCLICHFCANSVPVLHVASLTCVLRHPRQVDTVNIFSPFLSVSLTSFRYLFSPFLFTRLLVSLRRARFFFIFDRWECWPLFPLLNTDTAIGLCFCSTVTDECTSVGELMTRLWMSPWSLWLTWALISRDDKSGMKR